MFVGLIWLCLKCKKLGLIKGVVCVECWNCGGKLTTSPAGMEGLITSRFKQMREKIQEIKILSFNCK